MQEALLVSTDAGLYCPAGDFYVDPWGAVDRAVITHAHGDHATHGSQSYLCANDCRDVLQMRLGPDAAITGVAYGETVSIGGVCVSLHPAGHILGSAQVLIEHRGRRWVVSGDYKVDPDETCQPFEPVRCHTFITESTFGLPVYQWPPQSEVFEAINAWWSENAEEGRVSVIYAYSLGKAQRILNGLDASIGPIFCHGAIQRLNGAYYRQGVRLPATEWAGRFTSHVERQRAMILAPPSARGTPWLNRFGDHASGFASGWMRIRGARRRRSIERGFVLSDHADWPGLQSAIAATGAERVLVTHGSVGTMVRWLTEQGLQAAPLHTQFEGEQDETSDPAEKVDVEGAA